MVLPKVHSSVENLSGNLDEKIVIKSAQEFKERMKISSFPEGEIKHMFEKPLSFTQEELNKLRDKYLSDKPDLESIKAFIEGKRDSVIESAKKSMNELHGYIKKGTEINKKGSEAMQEDGKEAESIIDQVKSVGEDIGGTTGEAITEGTKKAKEVGKKIKEGGYTVQLGAALEDSFSKLKNFDIWGALVSLFKGIFGMFIGGEAMKKVGDKVKEKLSPEEIQKTKETVKKYIVGNFGDTLTEDNKQKLEKSLENISQEQLSLLAEKIKNGELSFKDISAIIPNIFSQFLEGAQIEKIKEEAKAKIIEGIKKEISNKYNFKIEGDKLDDLEKLVQENTKISNETIGVFLDINEKQQVKISDMFGPTYEAIVNSTSLLFGLLIKGIIPISAFGLEFADASTEVIKISASALGISKSVSIDMFQKSIENLNETEKALMVGLLYRKGGLLLNVLGTIVESSSRLGVEFFSKSPVKTYDLLKASSNNNYPKQIKHLKKIGLSLGAKNVDQVESILSEAVRNLNKVSDNYKILHILSKAEGDTSKALELFKKHNIKIDDLASIKKGSSFAELTSVVKDNIKMVSTETLSGRSAAAALGFGANADLFKLNSKLEQITKTQKVMCNSNVITKTLSKLRELSNIGEISRMGDRVTLHFESVDAAKKGVSKWNVIANKFPDLVKGTLDKLPIIAVAGISANSDKPFFEEFKKEMKYLFPIVGPILLVSDSGVSWKDGKVESINAVEAGIGGALLAVDGVFVLKEFNKGGLRSVLSYGVKPIKDLYGIAKGTGETAWSIGKAVNNGKSFSGIIKESVKRSKHIKGSKLKAIAIGIGILFIGSEIAFGDDELKEIFGEEGAMDKNKLKENIGKLNDDEKLMCLKYLVSESWGEEILKTLNISIEGNKCEISSNNSLIVNSDWPIDDEIKDILQISQVVFIQKPA